MDDSTSRFGTLERSVEGLNSSCDSSGVTLAHPFCGPSLAFVLINVGVISEDLLGWIEVLRPFFRRMTDATPRECTLR